MKLGRKNIADSSLLFLAMLLVNAGNYFINLALGRVLGPASFAEASIIATLVLMLSFIAVGIQLTSAKLAASESDDTKRNNSILWLNTWVTKSALVLSIVMLVASPFIKSYLHFQSILPLVIIAIGLPFFFALSIKRGMLQGTEQFGQLAKSYLLEMTFRLSITFVALMTALYFFEQLTTLAVAIGFLFSFFATGFFKLEKGEAKINDEQKNTILKFIAIIGIYELSQIVINNSDVILAKHFFEAKEAGLYAAIALIGRVVYFGTWTIVTLLFPKVIQREREGLPHTKLFWGALTMVACIGILIVLACYAFPEFIIGLLFGSEYLIASDLLWVYAMSTTLFACANVFAYYHLSLNNYIPVAITLIAGVLQLILIYQFHNSLLQIIQVQFALMSALFAVMLIFHTWNNYFKIKKQNLALNYSKITK